MSTNTDPTIDRDEWDAQERGRRAAAHVIGAHRDEAAGSDPDAAAYLQVALALRSVPMGEPPPGFAAEVAARASNAIGIRAERVLVHGFGVVVGAALAVVLVLYGPQCWEAVRGTMTTGSLRLLVAGAGCLGLSLLARRPLALRD